MRLGLALKTFFKVLGNAGFADQLQALLTEDADATQRDALPSPAPATGKPPAKPVAPPGVRRSEAIALLAALQREARLVDLIREPLDAYSDAQIGAAAREVLRDSRQVLDRLLGLEPASPEQEGAVIEAPEGYDAGCYRLTGQVSEAGPFEGELIHAGWRASKVELPTFSGSAEAALIIAPIEIEVN